MRRLRNILRDFKDRAIQAAMPDQAYYDGKCRDLLKEETFNENSF